MAGVSPAFPRSQPTRLPLQEFCSSHKWDIWRRAVASGGQLQRVLHEHTRLQSAFELIKQEIYFATQTFFGSVKKPAYAKATARQAPRFVAEFGADAALFHAAE